jgi:thiol:disulfide interchange protein DsbA
VLSWLKSKPDYVTFVRVPVMWGPVHRAHARLFYTLEALGRDDLVEKAFEEIHAYAQDNEGGRNDLVHADHSPLVGSSDEATLAAQLAFAKANGIDPDAFRKAYDSPTVQSNLQYAQEVTNRYQVSGVPLIIVDGKYSTDVGKAGSANELFQLVDSLTAAEHRKAQHG